MKYFSLLIILTLPWQMLAQQCEGNLGENIFSQGDFGSGTQNIPNQDPQIAPGYSYVRTGPPQDGSYVITNNTAAWSALYPTWLGIGDNSSDPNGYMLVVNASLDPGFFYEETVDNLCGNTLYEFSADVINLIRTPTTNHTLPQVDFLLGDQVVFSTGSIAQSEEWNTYGFTFRTDPGASEIKLSLRNNAPGGFGNDLAIDNISFRACGPSNFIGIDADQTIFLCEEDNNPLTITADLGNISFHLLWQSSIDGSSWIDLTDEMDQHIVHTNFQPGNYRYRYLTAPNEMNLQNFKCRTIADEIEIEVLPLRYEIVDTICAGMAYPFAGDFITAPGQYEANLVSSKNCDSLVTLNLHHISDPPIQLDVISEAPKCAGDTSGFIRLNGASGSRGPYSFFINNNLISSGNLVVPSGAYLVHVEDRYGCRDSVQVTLTAPDPFSIEAGPDTALIFGSTYDITISSTHETQQINWTPPEFLDCSDCMVNTAIGIQNIEYIINAENNAGCLARDTFRISVERTSLPIYTPNAFTPNQDGVNDYFNILSPGQAVQEVESLLIFDRWGTLIYQGEKLSANNLESGWDGTIENRSATAGVYVFTATLRLIDNTTEKRSGSVTLIR